MQPPFQGSRAERSLAELKRSAAFRGQSPREERGCGGEETHKLWTIVRMHHAAAWSASAGVLYPSEE